MPHVLTFLDMNCDMCWCLQVSFDAQCRAAGFHSHSREMLQYNAGLTGDTLSIQEIPGGGPNVILSIDELRLSVSSGTSLRAPTRSLLSHTSLYPSNPHSLLPGYDDNFRDVLSDVSSETGQTGLFSFKPLLDSISMSAEKAATHALPHRITRMNVPLKHDQRLYAELHSCSGLAAHLAKEPNSRCRLVAYLGAGSARSWYVACSV